MIHMGMKNDGAHNCAECEFVKMYDYGKRLYYCDHEGRIDDMGKLSVDHLLKASPEWCPLKCKSDSISAAK